ncbi:MAG: MAPEG family protein [Myxococcota bacterium]
MVPLRRRQRKAALLEFGIGFPCNAVLAVVLYRALPNAAMVEGVAGRIAWALQWSMAPALITLASIWAIALGRLTSEAIDPLAGRESKAMRVHMRVLSSNVEQLLLFVVAGLAAATVAGPQGMRLIAVGAVVLAVNRVVFWVGYLRDPLLRAVGVSGSIYPVSALVLFAAYRSAVAVAGG